MTQIKKDLPKLFKARSKAEAKGKLLCSRWQTLCDTYLPVKKDDSIWCFNRKSRLEEPLQGWKLHISATILQACDLFESVAPFLNSQDVQFKAPKSLDELSNINSGLRHGYQMLGKFMTVYPNSEAQAVEIAEKLHELTREFVPISVPFDEQFAKESSVFYRYGAFGLIEMDDENGNKISAIKKPSGELTPDDRFCPVPDWIYDPFKELSVGSVTESEPETPLTNTYKVFRAITQRGKGGTYHALDLSGKVPRFCIVKEGRCFGEVAWNGQDGRRLVRNEYQVLKDLSKKVAAVPQVYDSFEIDNDFYLVMEFIDGKNLNRLLKPRQRRLSHRQILKFAIELAEILTDIHNAGWIWNDCKPANLIVVNSSLRPIDFESSYPIGDVNPFDWRTKAFTKSSADSAESNGVANDLFSFGAVLYFLITGRYFDSFNPVSINKLRKNFPQTLIGIAETLLFDHNCKIFDISEKLGNIKKTLPKRLKPID